MSIKYFNGQVYFVLFVYVFVFPFLFYVLFNNKQVLHNGSHWFSVLIILLLQVDKFFAKFYVFFIGFYMAMSSVHKKLLTSRNT